MEGGFGNSFATKRIAHKAIVAVADEPGDEKREWYLIVEPNETSHGNSSLNPYESACFVVISIPNFSSRLRSDRKSSLSSIR
jgi:hypothetical protein